MAATSMKDIKNRIKSVENTMQITKAMELVASSKLRKAKADIEKTRPYFESLLTTISEISASMNSESKIFSGRAQEKKFCYIVIAGDRGLAGGFNMNLFKKVLESAKEDGDVSILPIGRKVFEYFSHTKLEVLKNSFDIAAEVHIGDCLDMGKDIFKAFLEEKFDNVKIFYTKFNSVLNQVPMCEQILPVKELKKSDKKQLTLYEPSAEAVLSKILPLYISGVIYGAVSESRASEYAARRNAMNNANKNAEEMIGDLTLSYNRARQAAITQEITEIVAGSN